MTSKNMWESIGLGKTGEVYAVGDDFLMRNTSGFFVENQQVFLQKMDKAQQILATDHQSNILISPAKNLYFPSVLGM